ncbi:MAG: hypothetical protein LBR57_00175 [Alistipes sp.]|jgi:hypothetical protein|nr:hypothetical protein [Alistipes sp.]
MRKILLLSIAAIAALQPLSAQAQQDKVKWFDLQVVQHIGFNRWSDVSYASAGLPKTSITELRGVFNFHPFRRPVVGFFADAGLGVMPAAEMRSFDPERVPMPNSGTRYYLRETLSEAEANNAIQLKLTAGMFGNITATDRLTFMPHLGIGIMTMSSRRYEVILKEDGSNMQYNATYRWGGNKNKEYTSDTPLGYVTGRLNFKYKMGGRGAANLLLGMEFTHFFDTPNFYGRFTNTFNGNVQRYFMVEGNRVNMLALSVGVSFNK